jgi:hypothetical protein
MTVAIGAGNILGIAHETVSGTYVAPTKFMPFNSEDLKHVQSTVWRRPIRNSASLVGGVAGNSHVEGSITMELLPDVFPYFLYSSRTSVVKTGTGPYIYTVTPVPLATPPRTMSISVKRNGEVFGYAGCVMGSFTITLGADGILMITIQIMGLTEATQAALTAVWPTSVPFGAGMYKLEIPTASQIFDADMFEFDQQDNPTPNFRIKDTNAGPSFIAFGESAGSIKVERDFSSRTDYDTFKSLTAQSLKFVATNGAEVVSLTCPVSIKDTYDIGSPSQGDLLRASITYQTAMNAAGIHYTIVVTTAELIA